MNGYVGYRHAFDQGKTENLNVLTDGSFILMRKVVYMECETDEDVEMLKTEVFYWRHLGNLI